MKSPVFMCLQFPGTPSTAIRRIRSCCSAIAVEMWRKNLLALPAGMETVLAQDAEIYFIDASFSRLEDAAEQQYLMKIPTTLYLNQEQLDHLFATASRLIRSDPDFQRLMSDVHGHPVAKAR